MLPDNTKKRAFSWFRLFLLVIFVYFIYIVAGQQLEIVRISREAQEVKTRLAQVSAENANLLKEKNDLSTLEYIEQLAREQLGMVKPGEIPYIPAAKP